MLTCIGSQRIRSAERIPARSQEERDHDDREDAAAFRTRALLAMVGRQRTEATISIRRNPPAILALE
ncbi:hypothetical protein GCM10009830_39820 [Glycomyces endophyticus]|uniref:Uncharacterized protein n=1 Tax=Glycomyces endophyticus TaxID=480996 RepID=A0ABP4THL8_9ACTN